MSVTSMIMSIEGSSLESWQCENAHRDANRTVADCGVFVATIFATRQTGNKADRYC